MQTENGHSTPVHSVSGRRPAITVARIIALAFVVSVALPISWGLASAQAQSGRAPAAAPESARELFEMAKRAVDGHREPIPPVPAAPPEEPPAPAAQTAELETVTPSGLSEEALLALAPQGLAPSREVEPIEQKEPASVREPEPTILAQAAPTAPRQSAASLMLSSAPAPQLSAVGASTSRSARAAARETDFPTAAAPVRPTNVASRQPDEPVPATRQEVEAARASQTQALSSGSSATRTRRSAAMHRMAAAAASSLNDATPFRTGGSGSTRFSSSDAGESLGESLDRAASAIAVIPGVRLENVTLGAGYSSNGLAGARSLIGGGNLGSDTDFTGSATLAYRKSFRSSSLGLTYTPSRSQRTNFTEWNSTDHVLGFEVDRQFGRRWGLAFNGSASNTGLEQFWFRNPVYRRIENPPTSLEELIARSEAGEFTDDEFASLITGAPIVDDPGGREIDLTRVVSYGATLSSTYAHSARTSVTMGLGASRFQATNLFGGAANSARGFAVNDMSRQHAFVNTAYRMSPGLTTGLRYTASQNNSNFADAFAQTAAAYVRKRLGRYWTTEVTGGAGVVNFDRTGFLSLQEEFQSGYRPTWTAGGSLAYRYGGHSFEGFGRRQVGNSLGLASTSSVSTGLSWQWQTPRMPWVVNGQASFQRTNLGFATFNGSSTALESSLLQAGLARRLTPTTAFSTGYYFGRYSSPLRGLLTGTTIHRVQATFLWRPVEPR